MASRKDSRSRRAGARPGERLGVSLLPACLLAIVAALPACVGYRTQPESLAGWPNGDPNVASVEDSTIAALKWAVERVPPPDYKGSGGQFAVSAPQGMRQSRYLRMVEALGPDAFAVTPQSEHLPTYFVGSVIVRGAFATIDVYCPILDRWGDIAYKPYTLDLEGGVHPWRVLPRGVRAWQVNAMLPPEKYYLPQTDAPVVTTAPEPAGG